jgi:prepilin-type N-terminal cleavage/methylation domain-containing protein
VTRRGSAGFSLVELLVALAVASAVIVGLGAIFVFAGELRSRTSEVAAVDSALVDVAVLGLQVERFAKAGIVVKSRTQFDLVPLADADHVLSFTLSSEDRSLDMDRPTLSFDGSPQRTSVDVSVFDVAQFEYLLDDAGVPRWTAAESQPPTEVLAARLLLKKRHRTWPLVIWVRPLL